MSTAKRTLSKKEQEELKKKVMFKMYFEWSLEISVSKVTVSVWTVEIRFSEIFDCQCILRCYLQFKSMTQGLVRGVQLLSLSSLFSLYYIIILIIFWSILYINVYVYIAPYSFFRFTVAYSLLFSSCFFHLTLCLRDYYKYIEFFF